MLKNEINNLLVYISTLRHIHEQACNRNFAKVGGLKVKFFLFENVSIVWRAKQSGATQSFHIDGEGGCEALVAGQFFLCFKKNNYFYASWNTFCWIVIDLKTFQHVFKSI